MPDPTSVSDWGDAWRTGGPFAVAFVLSVTTFIALWVKVIKPMLDNNGGMVQKVTEVVAQITTAVTAMKDAANAARDAAVNSEAAAKRMEAVIEVVKGDTRPYRIGPDIVGPHGKGTA